jgi:hypothetical protein
MPEPVGVPGSNIEAAWKALRLTPEEQNLYAHHLNNIALNHIVTNPDGSHSTLLQAVVQGLGGKFYNIPTVWEGKVLPIRQAEDRAAQLGWSHWPAYQTPEAADARYALMHKYIEQDQPIGAPQ